MRGREDYHLLAADTEPDLIDIIVTPPGNQDFIKWRTEEGQLITKQHREAVYDLIEHSGHNIIGDVHTHDAEHLPSRPAPLRIPGRDDLTHWKRLEERYQRPFYGLILGGISEYTIPMAIAAGLKGRKPRIRRNLKGKPSAEQWLKTQADLFALRERFGYKDKVDTDSFVHNAVRDYMKSIEKKIGMYDSSGKQIPLEIV